MSAILNEANNIEHLKLPPQNNEYEQSVIGGLLLENDRYHDISGIVQESHFYRQDHRLIFRSMVEVMETDGQFDIITLSAWLKDRDLLDDAGGLAYLGTLAKDTPSAANIVNYAKGVVRKSQYRELIHIGSSISEQGFNEELDVSEIIQTQGESLDLILEGQSNKDHDMRSVITHAANTIEENVQSRNTKGLTGLPSGLPELDKRLGGFQKKRMYLIASRPGGGKTALSNQIAIATTKVGRKVGILSLEMGTEEMGIRMLAHFYNVSGTGLTMGNAETQRELSEKIHKAKDAGRPTLLDQQIFLDTDTYSLTSIVARMTQWKRKHGLDMVIVDHLGLVENKGNNRNESVGEVSRVMKKMSKRLDIAMINLVQLNRENVKNNRRPQESDLRDSGSLEQDADVIMFLHVEEESKGDEIRPLWIGLSKVRYGIPGWIPSKNQHERGSAPFGFEGQTQTIREMYHRVTT